MTDKVKEELLKVRDSGKVNMFDLPAVQRLAFESGFYELVDYIEEHKTEYVHFILTGEE